jgi:hypothetical protein
MVYGIDGIELLRRKLLLLYAISEYSYCTRPLVMGALVMARARYRR